MLKVGAPTEQHRAVYCFGILGDAAARTVAKLAAELKTGAKPETRLCAALALQKLGWQALPHREVLLGGLGDDDAAVRAACVDALGSLGVEEALVPITGLVRDTEPLVRIAAVRAIPRFPRGAEHAGLLAGLLDDGEFAVMRLLIPPGRLLAGLSYTLSTGSADTSPFGIFATEEVEPESPVLTPRLATPVARPRISNRASSGPVKRPRRSRRMSAARVEQLLFPRIAAVDKELPTIANPMPEATMTPMAAAFVGWSRKTSLSASASVPQLPMRESKTVTRDRILSSVFGEESSRSLRLTVGPDALRFLESGPIEQQRRTAFRRRTSLHLGYLHKATDDDGPTLDDGGDSPVARLRTAKLKRRGSFGDDVAKAVTTRPLREATVCDLMDAVAEHADYKRLPFTVHRDGVHMLTLVFKERERLSRPLPTLVASDGDFRLVGKPQPIRQHAAFALGLLGEEAGGFVEAVADLLSDAVPSVRLASASALRTMGKPALPYLAACYAVQLSDPEVEARLEAIVGIRALGASAAECVPAVAAALVRKGEDRRIQEAAKETLVRLGKYALPGLKELLQHDEVYMRIAAARAIRELGPAVPVEALKLLAIVMLEDQDVHVRLACSRTLGALGVEWWGP